MVTAALGRAVPLHTLRARCGLSRSGVSLRDISRVAESVGLRTMGAHVPQERLAHLPTPFVLHWRQQHFVVVHAIDARRAVIGDPAHGLLQLSTSELWDAARVPTRRGAAVTALLFETTPAFFSTERGEEPAPAPFRFLLQYVRLHIEALGHILACVIGATLLGLAAPFLTQSIVDVGVRQGDTSFVAVLLGGYATLFVARMVLDVVRGWLVVHVGVRVNVAILSDFLLRLLSLPQAFFDARRPSDILQRIGDQARVERLLTSAVIQVVFSVFSTLALGVVLLTYQPILFVIFATGTSAAALWTFAFLGAREGIDYQRFQRQVESQSLVLQMVRGLPDIRISGAEEQQRWGWQSTQAHIARLGLRSLALGQAQEGGMAFLLEAKDILITFLSAREVIAGRMTLGMMLAVQYLLGQASGPLRSLLGFANVLQDARLGLLRLAELRDEAVEGQGSQDNAALPDGTADLVLEDVTFRYGGADRPPVLDRLSLRLQGGKTTAIVGPSGSGKTTLLKLLLALHVPTSGVLRLGGVSLATVPPRLLRSRCGAVLQDGYLFSTTIARNIALGDEHPELERVRVAAQLACIDEHIQSLPLGYGTKVGEDGEGLSRGQEQRVLLARALYRDPSILVLDEATSALDATNERRIVEALAQVSRGRTVVIVAHRLSTVRHADHIVVLERGRVIEEGTHDELVARGGSYLALVRNQLELPP